MSRVLYILRYYPTLSETFVYEEIRALTARGFEVTIASLGSRPDGVLNDALPDVPVLAVPRRPLTGRARPAGPGARWLRAHQRPKDCARLPWLISKIRDRFDQVHVHFAGEAAEVAHALWLELSLPYSVMVHATDLFKPRPSLVEVLKHAFLVTTVARHHQQHLSGHGITAELLRCGPDLDRWRPSPLPTGPVRALCVARDVPKKGLSDLLTAWRDLPVGSSLRLVSDLKQSPLPPGVEVLGLMPSSEIRKEMARCNLFVLPCRQAADGDMDGIPVAIMEAMACGRPVITTPVSGIPELVDDHIGWIVPDRDPDSLRAAIREAHDSELRKKKADRCRERLIKLDFTLSAQASGLQDLWSSRGF
jgi:glycosyltransferase involved in cell wall biosynthesis